MGVVVFIPTFPSSHAVKTFTFELLDSISGYVLAEVPLPIISNIALGVLVPIPALLSVPVIYMIAVAAPDALNSKFLAVNTVSIY